MTHKQWHTSGGTQASGRSDLSNTSNNLLDFARPMWDAVECRSSPVSGTEPMEVGHVVRTGRSVAMRVGIARSPCGRVLSLCWRQRCLLPMSLHNRLQPIRRRISARSCRPNSRLVNSGRPWPPPNRFPPTRDAISSSHKSRRPNIRPVRARLRSTRSAECRTISSVVRSLPRLHPAVLAPISRKRNREKENRGAMRPTSTT